MINTLEKRFKVVAFLVMTSVLLTLLIAVNIISIISNINRADQTLQQLSSTKVEDFLPSKIGPNRHPLNKERDRSFSIVINSQGEILELNYFNPNVLNNIDVALFVEYVIDNHSERGFYNDYRYLVLKEGQNQQIYFLDYHFEKDSESSFLLGSVIVFMTGMILFSILIKILLKPVMKPIKEAYDKQKRFITDASHELRTPLTIISTNVQLAEMDGGSSDWTIGIQKQVKRLENLSEGLVTLSRLDEESTHMEKCKVNLSNIANDVVMGFEPAIYAEEKELVTHIHDDIYVDGNYDGLEKVLSTLMHNALKYASKKGKIELNLTSTHQHVNVSIKNSTNDIKQGNHNQLFERFYRAEASRNSKTGGFGIGLAIAKSIIEEHKGKIEALSEDGQSFTIHITLKPYK